MKRLPLPSLFIAVFLNLILILLFSGIVSGEQYDPCYCCDDNALDQCEATFETDCDIIDDGIFDYDSCSTDNGSVYSWGFSRLPVTITIDKFNGSYNTWSEVILEGPMRPTIFESDGNEIVDCNDDGRIDGIIDYIGIDFCEGSSATLNIECEPWPPEICWDGIDNDHDNNNNNQLDNNGSTGVDCKDLDCQNLNCSEPGTPEDQMNTCIDISSEEEPENWQCVLNHPPSIIVNCLENTTTSDKDITCIGIVSDQDPWDKDFDVTINYNASAYDFDPTITKNCSIGGDDDSCQVNEIIPNEYTRVNDTIICTMRPYDGNKYGEQENDSVFIINSPPEIKMMYLWPDPNLLFNESDCVNYTQIFEKQNLTCTIIPTDPDEDDNLLVNYNITINPSGKNWNGSVCDADTTHPYMCLRNTTSKIGVKSCQNGIECDINIPIEDIFPSDNITCTAFVNDSFGETSPINSSNKVSMPFFDLYVKKIEVINVVISKYPLAQFLHHLILGKPHVVRVYTGFNSDFIHILDKKVNIALDQEGYEDSNYDNHMSNTWDHEEISLTVKNFPDTSSLKDNPLDEVFPGVMGYDMLKDIKGAKDSANFVKMDRITKQGYYEFRSTVNSADVHYRIKESDDTNNKLEKRSIGPISRTQLRPYKVKIYILGHKDDLPGAFFPGGEMNDATKDAIKYAKESIDMLIAVTPLINITIVDIQLMGLDYDREIFASDESYYKTWTGMVYPDLQRTILQMKILGWLHKAKGPFTDLAIGVTIDKNIMKDTAGVTSDPNQHPALERKQAVILGFNPRGGNSLFVLAHEFGHVMGDLQDEYNDDSIGKTANDLGWYFKKHPYLDKYLSVGPKINIWERDSAQTDLDYPEENDAINMNLHMGDRYFNIMGQLRSDRTWIDSSSYFYISKGLEKRKIISEVNQDD